METWVEVWIQGFSEATSGVSVNVGLGLRVVKRHTAFLIVQEHSDFLWGFLKLEVERRTGTRNKAASLSPADGPVTTVRTHRDESFLVDGLPGHTQIPLCFITDLEHNTPK